jgi:flagellin
MAIGDFVRVRNNIGALNAYNVYIENSKTFSKNQLKLSTGKDINEAADDPAGLTISTKLDARYRGMSVARDNVSRAKNLLSVAEGSLSSISELLITIKEKITRVASDTMGTREREATKVEIDLLMEEIDNIVDDTTFIEHNIIDGTFIDKLIQTGERTTDTMIVSISQDHTTSGLGITSQYVSDRILTTTGASVALDNINKAIDIVSDSLQEVGARVARLSVKESTLTIGVTNRKAAKSRIMDADIAYKQLQATRLQIMQSTTSQSISQLNIAPESVLALFQ